MGSVGAHVSSQQGNSMAPYTARYMARARAMQAAGKQRRGARLAAVGRETCGITAVTLIRKMVIEFEARHPAVGVHAAGAGAGTSTFSRSARAALCAEAAGLERGRCKRAGRTSGKECLHHADQANCEMYRPSSVQKLGSARRAGRECMRALTPVHGKQQNAWPTKQAAYAFAPPCTHPCCSCASHGRSGQPAARPCEAAGQRTTMWKGAERSHGGAASGSGGDSIWQHQQGHTAAAEARASAAHACMSYWPS